MELEINGLMWTIEEVETVDGNGHQLASTFKDTLHIVIRKDLPKTNFKKILIHEIAHAFIYSYGLDQVRFNEENLCDFISVNASAILKVADYYMDNRV